MLKLTTHPALRATSLLTAVLFFHVTLFLTIHRDGTIGVSEAKAYIPPEEYEKLPGVWVVPFQRAATTSRVWR